MKSKLLWLLLIVLSDKSYEEEVEHDDCIKFEAPSAHDPSIAYSEAVGQLGNNLLLYSFMLQLQISIGVESYVNDACYNYLSKYFEKDSILVPSLQRTFCDHDRIKFAPYSQHIRPLLVDRSYRHGHVLHVFPKTKDDGAFNMYKSESHECPEHDLLVSAYRRTARKTLRFKPEYVAAANEVFQDVAKMMGKKPKDVTFIGVHNRRTDHMGYSRKNRGVKPLKSQYFIDAMDEFREEFDHPAFLYVSDDMEWGRRHLHGEQGDLFFVGSDDSSDFGVGADLAVLALSNATVISRGTFSMFAAVLQGGWYHTEYGVIVPDELMNPDLYQDDLIL